MKSRYAGITATEKFLSVHAEVSDLGWTKYVVIKVPLRQLLHPEITDAMDREVRRTLVEKWSEVDLADPLF